MKRCHEALELAIFVYGLSVFVSLYGFRAQKEIAESLRSPRFFSCKQPFLQKACPFLTSSSGRAFWWPGLLS